MNAAAIIAEIKSEEGIEYIREMAAAKPRFDKFNRITCQYTGKQIVQGVMYFYSKKVGSMTEAIHSAAVAATEEN